MLIERVVGTLTSVEILTLFALSHYHVFYVVKNGGLGEGVSRLSLSEPGILQLCI